MKKILACLLLCGPAVASSIAFAVGTDGFNSQPKSKVVAVVRVEDGQAKCVKYSDARMAEYSDLQLPVCANEGSEAEQNQTALSFAQADGQIRTAFLSHLGMALGGCAMGVGMELAQEVINPYPHIAGAAFATTMAGIGGYTGGVFFSMVIGADPSGHVVAGVGGALVCGGAVTVGFIIYRAVVKR